MPAISLPGLSSGQNTNDVVRKLVDLESKPIKRWEKENNYHKVQIQAWKELKKLTKNLEDRTRDLVSFTAPFSSKRVTSNQEGVISGEANRAANSGKQKIEVEQLAKRNKVAGNKVAANTKIPKGVFAIVSGENRVDVEFAGGGLKKLKKAIVKYAKKVVAPALTRVDEENYVLSLQSIQYGESAKLKFLDSNGILKAAGLVGANVPEPPPSVSPIAITSTSGQGYRSERFAANKENPPQQGESGIVLAPGTAFYMPVNVVKIAKFSTLEFTVQPAADSSVPEYLGLGIEFKNGEGPEEAFRNLPLRDGKFVLNISSFAKGKELTRLIFSNPTSSNLTFGQVQYSVPGELQGAPPTNTIIPAQNAKLKVDGIEITRESNEGIRDAIEGVSLNVLKTTEEPVEMDIIIDTSKGMRMLKDFVAAYNDVIKFGKEISSSSKDNNIDLNSNINDENRNHDISEEYWNIKSKSGLLSGETSVMQLIAGLKTRIGAPYPSSTDPRFKVLSDVGITTGPPGSSWKQIQEGLLVIDEAILENALSEHPESVRELFASDNNDDNRPDDGLGVKIMSHIKPYTSFRSGVFATKIQMMKEKISENEKRIRNYESHLVNYEQRLKAKFRYMEQGVSRHKNVGSYLKNNYRYIFGKDR
ncbi:MAG: flagellar filament capping protein FliD [Spirochaetota bacterium]